MSNPSGISVIVPFYNESLAIEHVLRGLVTYLNARGTVYEIIAVDDSSTDDSFLKAKSVPGVTVLHHSQNRGYGAAIKTGVRHAQYDWVVWYDGDGQHTPEHVSIVSEIQGDEHMIVGARIHQKNPLIRRPGKWILSLIANYLVDTKIPDLNSGMRMVRKDTFRKFEHLYPDGFSISTTITLSLLKSKIPVRYVPIEIEHRVGKSSVSPKDAFRIFRIVTLFSPLRVFMPLSVVTLTLALISLGSDIILRNLTDTTVVLFLSTLMMFSFAITLDHVAAIRRDIHNL
jgi:glycosyltransferase involved in cell wall biosynthesis